MFLPSSHSFMLVKSVIPKPVIKSGIFGIQESAMSLSRPSRVEDPDSPSGPSSLLDSGRKTFLPNSHSFLLAKSVISKPIIQVGIQESATCLPPSSSSSDSVNPTIGDKNKRTFLKAAGIASASIAATLLLPKKADALIMGSSPTTGVVGVKNSTNARINPATEETVSSLSNLTFDTGSLNVKVTSLPAGGSSFSDSGNVDKKGLVDATTRRVQVDVLSSTLPSSASTETTLQTISHGGVQHAIRLLTVGDYDYVGEAQVGTLDGGTVWRIKRINNTATGIVIQWADGSQEFNKTWNSYAGYTYS